MAMRAFGFRRMPTSVPIQEASIFQSRCLDEPKDGLCRQTPAFYPKGRADQPARPATARRGTTGAQGPVQPVVIHSI
jgi:hypothetical protein